MKRCCKIERLYNRIEFGSMFGGKWGNMMDMFMDGFDIEEEER